MATAVGGSGTPQRSNGNRTTDREGFYITESNLAKGQDDSGRPLEMSPKAQALNRRREKKWILMMNDWDKWMANKGDKIKNRCRKGIPATVRGKAWKYLCGANALVETQQGVFEKYVNEANQLVIGENVEVDGFLDVIDKDLDRTFPHHERFSVEGGEGQRELRSVLRAYCMYNKELGYTQGMGMVAGTLLMQMSTEESFWCLVCLCDKKEYLKGFYNSGLREIMIASGTLHDLVCKTMPQLGEHFTKNDLEPLLYFTDWFMCAFVKTLPWQTVLRVWDMFLFEGQKILYRAALAILHLSAHTLLTQCRDQGDLMMHLRNDVDPEILFLDSIVPMMMKLPLKRRDITLIYDLNQAKKTREDEARAAKSKARDEEAANNLPTYSEHQAAKNDVPPATNKTESTSTEATTTPETETTTSQTETTPPLERHNTVWKAGNSSKPTDPQSQDEHDSEAVVAVVDDVVDGKEPVVAVLEVVEPLSQTTTPPPTMTAQHTTWDNTDPTPTVTIEPTDTVTEPTINTADTTPAVIDTSARSSPEVVIGTAEL
eukprot:m.163829 g.163829  ORF g.163829 m.163829 type:complete len:544 (+) comp31307_c0_seq1:262-1893(+)